MYSEHLVRQGGSFSGEEVDCDQNKHGCWNYSEEFQADMEKVTVRAVQDGANFFMWCKFLSGLMIKILMRTLDQHKVCMYCPNNL